MRSTLTVLILLISLVCHGQSPKLFTTDRELSSSLINHIYQDRNGFIWIATEDGLNRFDGAKFTIYKHEPNDEHSLAHSFIRTVFEDSKGHLFIGSYMGIQMYDPARDNFTPLARWDNGDIFESNIVSIIERKNGEVWISGNVLCKLKIEDNQLTVEKIDIPVSVPGVMVEDRMQNVWMSKGDEGLYRLSPDNQLSLYLTKDNGYINSICEDSKGTIYVGSMRKGLYAYDRQRDTFAPVEFQEKKELPISCIYSPSPNELYIGTDGKGIEIYNNKTEEISEYRFDNSYFDSKNSKIHSILKDNSGNLWLAVYQKGVIMIPARTNSFKYIGHKSLDKNIIGSSCITSFCKDHNGTLWIGTDNDGIYTVTEKIERLKHFTHTNYPNSVPATVTKIYEDSEHNMWIGSFINGMGKLDRQTGMCTYQHNLVDKNNNYIQRVYDFAEDKNKRLWIATMGFGLFYYDLKTKAFTPVQSHNTVINEWIDCLHYSDDNHLYVGTYDGLNCIDLNTPDFQNYKLLAQHVIYCIYEDSHGIIWIGSSEGLSSWNKETKELTTYTKADGLPSNTIYAIQGDENDFLWISTNAGISQFQQKNNKFINYYVGDGLQGNEFYKNASFKDKQGTIWFGGMNGITYFNPQDIINPAKKWNIRITDFFLHNKPVRKGMKSGIHNIINCPVFNAEEFYLSYKDNVFSIEFATLELNAPEHITYQYSINEEKWISLPKGVNRISFSNLKPGTYNFKIQAKDNTVYSNIKEISIYISPAWYASWWAKVIYCLLAIAVLLIIIQQIRHRYRMHQEMLQHIHAEQINEAKLQFFINISHEIRTPMSLIISPLQKLIKNENDTARLKTYHIIYRNAERILNLVNQLMDIRKIDKGQMSLKFREENIIPFIEDLCATFGQQANTKDIQLQLHTELPEMNVWVDTNNFDKIILNILSNAFKYTPEKGRIDITLRTGEDASQPEPLKHYAEITIADTGTGIDEQEKERIFERFYQIRNSQHNPKGGTGIGLHLTRSLVELHHGKIYVVNNEDQPGCRFIIRLPLGNQHLRPDEIDYHVAEKPMYVPTTPVIAPIVEQEEEKKGRVKSKYHVLIVEDDEEIRSYIAKEFADKFHIMESCNGKEALDLIFKKTPDLVISDIMMPEMDGLTLCKKIKQNVNLNHIPVILLTAKTREEDNLEGLNTGADAYIMKPFNIEILQKTVENLINTRQQLRKVFTGQQSQENKIQKLEAKSPDEKLMERIMKVINDNISNPNLTIEALTNEVGISRVHLHRKLKELTNQSTRDFIRNIRLKEAARLLSEKQYTISEIATLTGFTDPNNFSTTFKELYGMPPSMYMKEQLGKKE